MLTLYLMRHGETNYNKQGIVQGGGIDSDLNQLGRQQAFQFYKAYKHIRFEAIFASGLKRTHQTLENWKQQHYSIQIHPGINELSWGVMEGIQPSDAQKAIFRQTIKDWQHGLWDSKIEGGESANEVWERTSEFLEQLRSKHFSGNILICSHGRTIRVMLNKLLHIDMEDKSISPFHNTGLSILNMLPDGSVKSDGLNEIKHLNQISVH